MLKTTNDLLLELSRQTVVAGLQQLQPDLSCRLGDDLHLVRHGINFYLHGQRLTADTWQYRGHIIVDTADQKPLGGIPWSIASAEGTAVASGSTEFAGRFQFQIAADQLGDDQIFQCAFGSQKVERPQPFWMNVELRMIPQAVAAAGEKRPTDQKPHDAFLWVTKDGSLQFSYPLNERKFPHGLIVVVAKVGEVEHPLIVPVLEDGESVISEQFRFENIDSGSDAVYRVSDSLEAIRTYWTAELHEQMLQRPAYKFDSGWREKIDELAKALKES